MVGAGVGLLVLYRVNPRLKENLLLTAILYSAGVLTGSLMISSAEGEKRFFYWKLPAIKPPSTIMSCPFR